MAVAADVLAEIDPAARPPQSVRESGVLPWRLAVGEAEFAGTVAIATAGLAADQVDGGTLAVIAPAGRLDEIRAAVQAALPKLTSPRDEPGAADDTDRECPVVVLTVKQVKGVEFDAVLVADPGLILAESRLGLRDLYVALTRATQRVGVIHTGEVPRVLRRLTEVASVTDAVAVPAIAATSAVTTD